MAIEPFAGVIPADRLYDPATDMWVVRGDDGRVSVGATAFGLWLMGEVIAFTAKPRGAEVAAGRGLGTVESAKTVLAVRAPVSFRLLDGNDAAEERPALVNREPYGAGWMAAGEPLAWEEDCARLVDAAAYRAHCLRMAPDARIEVA